jgi:D-alanine--poly(phosphoribitol) ligase subunit 1
VVCDDAIDLFFARAAEAPAHPAVVVDGQALSYAALAGLARRLAAVFARVREPRVLIALPAGAEAYAAMLGAGLAGGFYTPVNIDSPPFKLRRIARLLRPNVIVAEGELGAALAAEAPDALLVAPSELPAESFADTHGRRHRTAYVMFTSGSTGEPKGVVIPRAALDHYVAWMRRSRMFTAADRVSQYANIGFDFSVMEIYGGLCGGATLYPVLGQGTRLFPASLIAAEQITVWSSVPSVISLMTRADSLTAENLASLRLFNFCGEPLLPQHLAAIFAACPGVVVQNTYGPTEATVSMTSLMMTAVDYKRFCRASVALGDAIPGMGLNLVGGRHPDEGEIVITGPQIASGYWRDDARTAELFRPLTIDGASVTGYFTGDWAERHDGHVYFKERMDFQVKIKGVRVELDEVAAALRDIGWPVVCVLSRDDHLIAVVERRGDARFDRRAMIDALSARLDAPAIPGAIHLIDQMPRNENGKIDRRAVASWLDVAEGERAGML